MTTAIQSSQQRPAASPQARWLGLLSGVLLVGLTALAVHELVAYYRWADGVHAWLPQIPGQLATWTNPLIIVVGVIAALVGLWFVIAALSPRPKRHRQVPAESPIWVRPVSIARFATATAKSLPAVISAQSKASRRKVSVDATMREGAGLTADEVASTIENRLSAVFGSDLKVTVSLNTKAAAPDYPADATGETKELKELVHTETDTATNVPVRPTEADTNSFKAADTTQKSEEGGKA